MDLPIACSLNGADLEQRRTEQAQLAAEAPEAQPIVAEMFVVTG